MAEKLPWNCDCDATRAGMERFIRALVRVGGHFTDSFTLHTIEKPTRGVTVFFRIWLVPGTEQRFLSLAEIDEIKPPPRVDLGWSDSSPRDIDDGRRPIARALAVELGKELSK